jgi:hypothetical protein
MGPSPRDSNDPGQSCAVGGRKSWLVAILRLTWCLSKSPGVEIGSLLPVTGLEFRLESLKLFAQCLDA